MKKTITKKAASLFLAFVVAFGATVFASAEDRGYDILIETAEVLIIDDESSLGGIGLRMSVPELEKYEYVRVNIDFNTDIIEHHTSISQPIAVFTESCVATETGVSFYVSWNDEYADRADGWNYSTACELNVTGEGKHNITVTAYAKDIDGNDVDVRLRFKEPYERVVKKSEVEFVEFTEDYVPENYRAVFSHGTDVSTALSKVKAENKAILTADGEMLTLDAKVPNGSRIVTLFEGYVVSSFAVLVPYDVNCDGRVTAADARLALRNAAKIEYLYGISHEAADVNGIRGITAADARQILRVAAMLNSDAA